MIGIPRDRKSEEELGSQLDGLPVNNDCKKHEKNTWTSGEGARVKPRDPPKLIRQI